MRVGRAGAKAQARNGYGTPSASASKRTTPPAGLPPALGDAFQSPVPITDIELSVTSAPRRGPSQGPLVAITVEGRGKQEMDLVIGAADAGGKMQAFKRGVLKPAAGDGDIMQATAQFDLKPGRYHVRVAALQKDGARGSVQHDLVVPDFAKEELSVSGVTLIEMPRRRPTTRRSFSPAEKIDIAAEIYWTRGLAQPVTVTTSVTRVDDGDVVYHQEGVVEPQQRPQQGVDFGATLDPERWPPGTYQLIVEARTAGARPLVAKRELPFEVTAR